MKPTWCVCLAAITALSLAACGDVNGAQPIKVEGNRDLEELLKTPKKETESSNKAYVEPKLFFIKEQTQSLQGQSSTITTAYPLEAARLAMRKLAAGVPPAPTSAAFSTALPKDTSIKVLRIVDRVVYLDLKASVISPVQKPKAFGQIVLTATSINGIDRVTFQSEGRVTAAVLPQGKSSTERTTTDPVGQDEYALLLKPVRLIDPGAGTVVDVEPTSSTQPARQ